MGKKSWATNYRRMDGSRYLLFILLGGPTFTIFAKPHLFVFWQNHIKKFCKISTENCMVHIPLIRKVCLWVPPFHININSEQSCKLNTLYIFCNLENQETETSWLKKKNWFLKPLLYVNFPLISLALPCSLENHQTAYAMCQQH